MANRANQLTAATVSGHSGYLLPPICLEYQWFVSRTQKLTPWRGTKGCKGIYSVAQVVGSGGNSGWSLSRHRSSRWWRRMLRWRHRWVRLWESTVGFRQVAEESRWVMESYTSREAITHSGSEWRDDLSIITGGRLLHTAPLIQMYKRVNSWRAAN